MEALEKEYNELSQRDVENTVADSIRNLLSDLIYDENTTQNVDLLTIEKPKVSFYTSLSFMIRGNKQLNEIKECSI